MSVKEKLEQKLKNNPKNAMFEDLQKLLELNGYKLNSTKGSHHTFAKAGAKHITLPFKKPMNAVYTKAVLDAISQEQK